MHRGDDNDHQWYPKAGVEQKGSILYSPESRGGSKSLRSLPSKLRPLGAHEHLWTFFIMTVDGLAAIQLESLHSATLMLRPGVLIHEHRAESVLSRTREFNR